MELEGAARGIPGPAMEYDDAELLRLLAAELRLDGGCSELSMLPTYNPRIRKLLGERKLWGVVKEHPRYFHCFERAAKLTDGEGATTSTLLVRLLQEPAPQARAVVTPPPGGWPHQCSGCNAGFGSRNALFKHLRRADACPAASASTVPASASAAAGSQPAMVGPLGGHSVTAKALVVAVQCVLREQQQAGPVPLPWVVTPAKSRSALRKFVRESGALAHAAETCPPALDGDDVAEHLECGSLEPFQPRWWLVAMRALHALLCSLPSLFQLSQPASDANSSTSRTSPLSSTELRSCTVLELERRPGVDSQDAVVATASEAESAAAVILRVVQLLEWQEIKGGRRCNPQTGTRPHASESPAAGSCAPPVSLGVIARDKGLQKHLGCRPLLPLLKEQCAQLQASDRSSPGGHAWPSSRRLRLVDEPTRGWCAQLLPPGSHPSSETTASPVPTHLDASAGACLPSTVRFQSHDPEILKMFPGAVAVNKPCGVSTEAVIDWLQHHPPDAVRKELERGAATEHRPGDSADSDAEQRQWMERTLDTIDQRGYKLESVSRLDKPTSGVLLVPLSRNAFCCLTDQFRDRSVEKTYLCLCQGVTEPEAGTFHAKLRTLNRGRGSKTAPHPQGKEALTEYRRVAVYSTCGTTWHEELKEATPSQEQALKQQLFSLCEVYPRTGRTHQIRAHFACNGYPLVGDVKYGGPPMSDTGAQRKSSIDTGSDGATDRLFLHSARLRFTTVNDETQERVQHDVSAPLPTQLSAVLAGMTKMVEDTDTDSPQ